MPPHVSIPIELISERIDEAEKAKEDFIKEAMAYQFSRKQAELLYMLFKNIGDKDVYLRQFPKV